MTAWSGLYYAAFALILGAAAVIWRIAQRDRWIDVMLGAVPVAGVGLLALLGFVPGAVTVLSQPPSAPLAERMPIESVTFAGNLAMALIPAPISQLPGMWRYNEAVYAAIGAAPVLENTALTNFGTWITSACLVVFLVGLVVLSRRARLSGSPLPLLSYLTVFSYGAVKSTEASTTRGSGQPATPRAGAPVGKTRFCAIHVDRRGFTEKAWQWVTLDMRMPFGPPIATGNDGDWETYVLHAAG